MTKHRNQILLALCAAALLGAAAAGRAAIPFTLNFDGPGSTADDFAPVSLTLTSGPISGAVKTIVLPSTAFYDNIAAVPETDAWSIAMLGIIGVASLFRRGRRKS